ncbi:MAG: urease accessory protein UreF [Gammaproteobacteria bacterium]|jgi:urease accessory protein|nr:urease accessory protein UreF [Gammaproteobacteria bacterium]
MNKSTEHVQSNIASLRLWQLISPALPIGAYAYSQGLEYAIESGWIHDEAGARQWISGILGNNVSRLDIPVLGLLYQAWQQQDRDTIDEWNHFLLAARESAELKSEDAYLGGSLRQLLIGLDVPAATLWPATKDSGFANMFALAAVHWQIPLQDAAMGYLWAWTENQVAAAIKLVPLGQVAGQRILSGALELIPDLIDEGLSLPEADIGAFAPGLAIASALHETQYTRLFRS